MTDRTTFILMAVAMLGAIVVAAAMIPTSAKADRLPYPEFYLECLHYFECQDV